MTWDNNKWSNLHEFSEFQRKDINKGNFTLCLVVLLYNFGRLIYKTRSTSFLRLGGFLLKLFNYFFKESSLYNKKARAKANTPEIRASIICPPKKITKPTAASTEPT